MTRRRDPAFAFGLGNIQKGPWRPTLEEAQADAIDADCATMDEDAGTLYMDALADIWITQDLVPVFPRDPKPAPKNGPSSEPALSRIDRIIARREAQERAVS